MTILYSLGSVVIISLISIISAVFLTLNETSLQKMLKYLMSFAAGALLGDAFFHLLPEASEEFGFTLYTSISILLGILVSFILEKYVHWRHCHDVTSEHQINHRLAKMNLFGDFVHNFLDGMIIAGSFASSVTVGISTSIAIILHEIPQEISDLGVLLYSGVKKGRAIFLNFLTSLSSLLGVAFTIGLASYMPHVIQYLIPFSAGSFIYIACADLIPELHKESKVSTSFLQLVAFISGMIVLSLLLLLE